jgi:uncharacterized repeat protein (TIGR03803 family)
MILKKLILTFIFFLIVVSLSAQPGLIGVTSNGGNEFGTLFKTDDKGNNLNNIHLFDGISGANPRYTQLTYVGNHTLYGLTTSGGKYNNGVLFEFNDSLNTYTKRFDFSEANGITPTGSLIFNNGKLYGLTSAGGNFNHGVIFEYTISNQSYQILAHFNGASNGRNPFGSVTILNNKLYGLTYQGGTYNAGVLFEYDLSTDSLKAKVEMDGTNSGRNPFGSLYLVNNKLYGMTFQGGQNNFGIIFEYSPSIDSFQVKFNFNGTNSGSNPYGELELAPNGLLYGMTFLGGTNNIGTLFEFNIQNDSFVKRIDCDGSNYGRNPFGKLVHTGNGILYGLTSQGGSNSQGTLFEYNTNNSTLSVRVNFNGSNGRNPFGSVVLMPNQKIVGLTNRGGLNNSGVLFEYSINNNTFTVKKHLNQSDNGYSPQSAVINPYAYSLFGTTVFGGTNQNNGATNLGTLYEYDLKNNEYYKRTEFSTTLGFQPTGQLCYYQNRIWGVTRFGGNNNDGTIYEYNPQTLQTTKKADFNYSTVGAEPIAGLALAQDNNLYGVTSFGGNNDFGTLFKFNPSNSQLTPIIDFDDTLWGFEPNSELFQASNGKLYGVTTQGGKDGFGVLFEVDIQNQNVNKLLDFNNNTIGYHPSGSLIAGNNNTLIGITIEGGNNNKGTLYTYHLGNDSLSTIHHFDTLIYPSSSSRLTAGQNNKIYSTSNLGGKFDLGQLFEYDLSNSSIKKTIDFNYTNSGRPSGKLTSVCLPTESNLIISSCDSLISPSSKYIFKQSGLYRDTIPNYWGCDSFIQLQVTIKTKSYSSIITSACQSYITPDGRTIDSSGEYISTINNYLGCDSVINIHLSILNSKSRIDTAVCQTYMAPNGSLHQESKSFNVVIPNSKGCDSLIQINLKIKNSSSSINTSSCRVYVDPIGNPHYDSDSFSVTIANYLGCDSLISIKLTVIKPNINVISEDTLLTASTTQVDYQWYVCSPQWQKIEGATSRTFRPNINGEYAVEITQNNCKDTSNCVTVNKLYVNELNASKIEVYPNPSNGIFTIKFKYINNYNLIEVWSMLGQKIDERMIANSQSTVIDLSKDPKGVYLLKVWQQNQVFTQKIIIE